ncbi:hypothetical protein B0T24DRAFT_535019 [Lasiosphaeria ovina]|uniref:ASCH domain-containing protein n=1 Tax=Lasiosphaeria ovina TaxID=92902 RepID=A0AAE0N1N0_9PEZI|nr:hypothetical protein B0T24DRAFT_535019 [Lasiosphaeria ovina]
MPRHAPPATSSRTDVILPMRDPYMSQILSGAKNHEFRKYRLSARVARIWVYRTAPHSALTHICSIAPGGARTRVAGVDAPLTEDGLGNAEFNARHADWEGYDFAYRILSVWELRTPVPLAELRAEYGFRAAPRGLVYLPRSVAQRVVWHRQTLIIGDEAQETSREFSVRADSATLT